MLDTIARRLLPSEKASLPEKAVTGPGAAVMSWGIPLDNATRNAQQMMREAQAVYARGNRWVKRAEMTISGRVGSVPWHLETDDGETITDESSPELRRIRDLFEKPLGDEEYSRQYPSQPSTRRAHWGVTSRHAGLCNVAFWHLDEIDAAAGFPVRLFLIRPDRMTPRDENGRLIGWKLDADSHGGGTDLSLEEVLPFYLDQPDKGHFGTGLVESILTAINLPNAIDRHAIDTLSSGGRLPGIYAPKETGGGDDPFDRMVTDLRTIKDMPDSSKRDIVARVPIEFTPTAADMNSLSVQWLSQMGRDDILTHWGVPLSTIGGSVPTGLNSGESRKYDEAALWQNAIQFRIDMLYETIQYRLLDRLQAIGLNIRLVIDTPEFDDDAPKYDLAAKAESQPLRNIERRALLGLDPFGDPTLDNAVWMPVSVTELALAPATAGAVEPPRKEEPRLSARDAEAVGVLIRAGFKPEAALAQLGLPLIAHTGLLPVTLQAEKAALDRVRETSTARIKRDLAKVLSAMGRDIAGRVREKSGQVARKPSDYQLWLPKSKEAEWAKEIAKVLNPHLSLAAETVGAKVHKQMGKSGKADSLLGSKILAKLMGKVGDRIKGIIDTTRDDVRGLIERGLNEGLGAAELGDLIEQHTTFGELRAETIARTETGTILNQAAAESYREFGVDKVRIIDGDGDDLCASADGQEWSLEEFESNPLGHPNCVRDAVPVI